MNYHTALSQSLASLSGDYDQTSYRTNLQYANTEQGAGSSRIPMTAGSGSVAMPDDIRSNERAGQLTLVCSNRRRPSVQKGAKGNQFWRRDVFHFARDGRTLCGLDASDYLMIDGDPASAASDPNICSRCSAKKTGGQS